MGIHDSTVPLFKGKTRQRKIRAEKLQRTGTRDHSGESGGINPGAIIKCSQIAAKSCRKESVIISTIHTILSRPPPFSSSSPFLSRQAYHIPTPTFKPILKSDRNRCIGWPATRGSESITCDQNVAGVTGTRHIRSSSSGWLVLFMGGELCYLYPRKMESERKVGVRISVVF